ncbi:SAG family member [Eimeria mitis]|uniref:SAG family member n=1 Tax=Eimeria mitis TaxID=44415 RepID=U6JYF9_9EIME|nr:SAG family member [Eimeria mitis]CDJ28558.1 SAG family member [Eimeria mitis]
MAAFKLFSLASASAFLMANAVHQTAKQTSLKSDETSATYTVKLGKDPVCLDDINAAREAAGLEHFKTESSADLGLPSATMAEDSQHNTAWDPVCEALTANVCILCFSAGDEPVCLDEINAAREAAGLEHFKTESSADLALPSVTVEEPSQHNAAWDPVCEALTAEESAGVTKSATENGFKSGTYAYMELESEKPDCASAVSHWKDAVSNFTTIPPAKNGQTTLYNTQQNISFVALYNPLDDAAADCRVVTCTRSAATPSPGGGGVAALSTGEGKTGYALLCMTTPEALTAEAPPFDEEQWKKIKASITGSASAVAPSLLAVAIAAVGLLAL